MQGVISAFLYLLTLALCPDMQSIVVRVPWAAEKKADYLVFGGMLYSYLLSPSDL